MNIEEMKEFIETNISRCKNNLRQYNQIEKYEEILDFIESQQKTIEDMKCCGNCKHYQDSSDGYICNIGSMEDNNISDCCDNWELKQ